MVRPGHRRCTGCKMEFPATPKYFWRSNRERDGLRLRCKLCCRELPCIINRIAKDFTSAKDS